MHRLADISEFVLAVGGALAARGMDLSGIDVGRIVFTFTHC